MIHAKEQLAPKEDGDFVAPSIMCMHFPTTMPKICLLYIFFKMFSALHALCCTSSSSAFSSSPPVFATFSLMGIALLVFGYVLISYLVFDLVSQLEDGIDVPSSPDDTTSGLSIQELEELPCFYYVEGKSHNTSTCPVCLDGLQTGEKCRIFPACKHTFHAQCVDLWLARRLTCPTCRAPFEFRASKDVVQ